jgi:hypothetical protein
MRFLIKAHLNLVIHDRGYKEQYFPSLEKLENVTFLPRAGHARIACCNCSRETDLISVGKWWQEGIPILWEGEDVKP